MVPAGGSEFAAVPAGIFQAVEHLPKRGPRYCGSSENTGCRHRCRRPGRAEGALTVDEQVERQAHAQVGFQRGIHRHQGAFGGRV